MTTTLTADSVRSKIEDAFPFSVDKLPLSGPEGLRTPHYGLFRGDTGESVGVAVKKGYEPHTVDDIAALAESASSAFGDYDTQVSATFIKGVHHAIIAPSQDYRRSVFGSDDNIFPRMVIRAGFDGRAFLGSLGFYRDACDNLMMLRSDGRQHTTKIPHTTCLRERLGDLRIIFSQLASGWDSVVETARALDSTSTDLAQFLTRVYPLAEGATRRTRNSHERRVSAIVSRIMGERTTTGRGNLSGVWNQVSCWEALNGVQGYVQHTQTRRGRPGLEERAIIALDDPAVSRATELALELAS